jgi:hypothetical protein
MGGNTLIAAVEESSLSWLQKQLTCDEHDEHTCCNDQSALKIMRRVQPSILIS